MSEIPEQRIPVSDDRAPAAWKRQGAAYRGLPYDGRETLLAEQWHTRASRLFAACIILAATVGCDGKPRKAGLGNKSASKSAGVAGHAPRYSFAAEVSDADPEVAAFVRSFLETCLTGDYDGYRRFCSLRQNPESRDRFTRVYQAISKLTVREISPVEVATLPRPTYRIVNEVEFVEGKTPVFGEDRREIAILVFREEGQWRVLPAPTKLQPPRKNRIGDSQPTSAATSEPVVEYPWDQSGDG